MTILMKRLTKAKAEQLIQAFTQAALELDIVVRTERLTGAGGVPVSPGLALVEDKWTIFLEKRQPPRERLAALVAALDRFDLSKVELDETTAAYWAGSNPLL